MAQERVERRLAAILAADVAGYSRLMGADEAGTLATLKSHREAVVDPKITEHQGRIVKTTGDGMLVEFPSVVEAVLCAVEIQKGLAELNAGVAEDRRMLFRVGINVGDIIIDGDDIYGDGVNVAARLEGLAEPGGICVRRAVRNQVRDKLPLVFEDLGEVEVKNIARPVRAFRVLSEDAASTQAGRPAERRRRRGRLIAAAIVALLAAAGGVGFWLKPWAPEPGPYSDGGTSQALADKPSIAVLPFANISNDPEQEYFADGMTDDLITDLSKVSGLFVIARNSVFTYKGRAVNVQEVGRDLGVRYVLEGSVRRAGGRVRVNAQLIDTTTGHHLWAERYDRDYINVFVVQDDVIGRIVSALEIKLTNAEQTQLSRLPTESLKAYDTYLRAEQHYHKGDGPGLRNSLVAFEEAIALDPDFALAYAHYARAAVDVWRFDYISVMPGPLARQKASDAAGRALELDPDISAAHYVIALLRMVEGAHAEALEEARRAIYLDPNNAEAYLTLAIVLGYAGRHAESLDAVMTVLRLNPKPPRNVLRYYGWVLVMNRRYAEAIEVLEPIREESPEVLSLGDSPGEILAMAYSLSGREADARAEADRLIQQSLFPNLSFYRVLYSHHKRAEDLEFRLDALRRAGVPEWPFGYQGNPADRLDAAALEEITAGRTWAGWDMSRNLSFVREASGEGEIVYANAGTLMSGTAHVRGDMLCERYEIFLIGREQCGYVYRNPEGTPQEANEYTYVNPTTILKFSIQR